MRKVAIYARVSTEHKEQLSALENQIQYYDELMARHHDWILVERYIDKGITGTSTEKRPNFMRMMEDAKNGCFDLIVTREVSRFARNTVDTLSKTRELAKMGVEVYFTEDNIWTFNKQDGELRLSIMATLAQNESGKISARIKAGQKITFLNGVPYGNGNILGYDRVDGKMIINEKQAESVRLIFDLYLKGNKSKSIQYELEKAGYLTASGLAHWDPATIIRILRNPFYCGTIVYNKSYIPDFLEQKPKKNNGEVEQIVVEGSHTPIVSKEEFNKVQEMIAGHRVNCQDGEKRAGKLPTTIYGKKLICQCGSTMQKRKYHISKDGEITLCYQCYAQRRTGTISSRMKHGLSIDGICSTRSIPEWKLRIVAFIVFNKIWYEKEQILSIIESLLKESVKEDKVDKIETEKLNLKKQIDSLNKKSDNLLDALIFGTIDKERYTLKNGELEKEIGDLRLQLLKYDVETPTSIITVEERLRECERIITSKLNYKRGEVSDELVDSFVRKIVVDNDHIEWHLNFANELGRIDKTSDRINDEDIFLGRIVITKDDADNYAKYHDELSRVHLTKPLLVDLYI